MNVSQLLVLDDARKPLEDRRLARDRRYAPRPRCAACCADRASGRTARPARPGSRAALGRCVGQRLDDARAAVLDGLHGVGDDERAERRAADDDVLPRLPDHADMPAHGHEAAEQAAERDDETDEDRHVMAPDSPGHPSLKRFVLARA